MSNLESLRQDRASFMSAWWENLRKIQEACFHDMVAHCSGFTSYGTYHPIRICMLCGLEETGGWWCYSADGKCWHDKDDYGKAVLGSREGRKIIEVPQDKIYGYRP